MNFKLNTTKKFVITTILEVIFTTLLILLLVYVRQQSLDYLQQIQSSSSEISELQQYLGEQNLTSYDQERAQATLDNLDSILNKALLLVKVILPISLFLLSFIFYYLIWKINSNITIKRFFYYVTIPLILFLITIFYSLNYIAYYYNFIEKSPLPQLIIFSILLVISYYLSLLFLSNKKAFKENLFLAKKNLKKLIFPLVLIIITNVAYPILVFILFFFTYVKASITVPSIILLILIIIINIQRIHLSNKISKLA